VHEGAGDCEPSCRPHFEGGRFQPVEFPHVDLLNGALLAVVTPIPEPRWTTIGVAC
jgi:hypothetical protein